VRGASFGAFAEAVARNYSGARQDYQGNLSACLKLEGLMGAGNGRTVTGNGWIAISDGRVFMLPVFGKFSDFMTKVVPGLDFVLRQGDARAEFTIADSKVHSDRVSVEGDVLSLAGGGWYSFSDDLDFDVKMTLMKEHTLVAKLLRVVTYPISKLFEFRVRGSFAEPAWYPVNFSSDLLEHLGLKESDE
jgi:hypothetical protein